MREKCFTLRKNNQMKEILAQAYDLVEIVRNVNSCFLQKDPNNLKLSDYREAELACKRIDELHLHEPILFYCHLDDELQDDNRFDRLRTKIIDSIKKYMEWFLSNSAILCRRVNTLSPVFAEIEKEADERFSKELRDTSERMIYVSRGDQEVIRPFTRRYGFISGPNGELTQEQIQELLPSARRMIEYFNLPFKVPDQFLDLYNWFQDGYKPLYFKTQDECAEVKRRRDDYVLLLWHRVDTNVFEALYDRIIPFNVELQEDPNKKIKARGEHGTPKNVQCFRDCFITADDFETFLSVAEDYARIHNMSGPDAASAYRYLKVRHLKTGVAMSRFLKYFNDDYPTLYTRKANSNVMASEYSAFVNSLKKKYE